MISYSTNDRLHAILITLDQMENLILSNWFAWGRNCTSTDHAFKDCYQRFEFYCQIFLVWINTIQYALGRNSQPLKSLLLSNVLYFFCCLHCLFNTSLQQLNIITDASGGSMAKQFTTLALHCWGPKFIPWWLHVEFMVDKLESGQVFLGNSPISPLP